MPKYYGALPVIDCGQYGDMLSFRTLKGLKRKLRRKRRKFPYGWIVYKRDNGEWREMKVIWLTDKSDKKWLRQ